MRIHKLFILVFFGLGLGFSLAYVSREGEGGGVKHVFAEVRRGTLVSSIDLIGKVLSLQQVEIRSGVSGKALFIGAKTGEYMRAGTLIARLDSTEGEQAVRDAEDNLQIARLDLEEIMNYPSEFQLARARNALQAAKEAKENASEELRKSYEGAFDAAGNIFFDFPRIITDLQEMFYSTAISGGGIWNIDFYTTNETLRDDAKIKYDAARKAYEKASSFYRTSTRRDETHVIQTILADSDLMARAALDAIRSANNLIRAYQDEVLRKGRVPHSTSDTHLVLLSEFEGLAKSFISTLALTEKSIADDEVALARAKRFIEEGEIAFQDVEDGPDELEVRARELEVGRLREAFQEAKQILLQYEIRAPFDGILAKLNILEGDEIFFGGTIATFSTRQKVAEFSLDEKDVVGVKLGQKVVLTFDAIPDFSITGEVAEVDTLGSLSLDSAVYNAKVVFDTSDLRIKPAMKARVSIILQSRRDVLLIPNSAVKSEGELSYVEIPTEKNFASLAPPLRRAYFESGVSNSEYTEILGGLEEGDSVLVRKEIISQQ